MVAYNKGDFSDPFSQDLCGLSQTILSNCIGADTLISTQVPGIYDALCLMSLIAYV